jgi:hypothetical protein
VGALRGIIRSRLERGGSEGGVESCKTVPGFVHDQLNANRVCRFNNWAQIVTQAVVGATGQNQRLRVGMMLDCLEQGFLGDWSKHAVTPVDARVEINGVCTRKHHTMMHAFVAVAIQQ